MRIPHAVAAGAAAITAVAGIGLTYAASSDAETALALSGVTGNTATISVQASASPDIALVTKVEHGGSTLCAEKVSGPGGIVVRSGTSTSTLSGPVGCWEGTKTFASFAATVAGDYRIRVFSDENGSGVYEESLDKAAPVLALKIADFVPTVTLRAPEDSLGKVTLDGGIKLAPAATLTDVRGATALGQALAAKIKVKSVEGPCGDGNVTGLKHDGAVTFATSDRFEFDLGTVSLAAGHNGGTVKVVPTGPEASPLNSGVADVAWLHSAKPEKVEVVRLGDQSEPSGKKFRLGDRGHFNAFELVARVSAPGPVRLECPLVDVATSGGVFVLDGDTAVDDLHAATAITTSVNTGVKTVEYTGSDLKFDRVIFTRTGSGKITVSAGDQAATITPEGDISRDPSIIEADPIETVQGKPLDVKGKVLDLFGNPVPNTPVKLGGVSGNAGVFAAQDITTGADGTWVSRFDASDRERNGSYSASLPGVASAGAGPWLGTSLVVPATVTEVSRPISVGAKPEPRALSLSASGALAGQTIRLTGTAPAGTVKITASPSGAAPVTWTVPVSQTGTWAASFPANRTVTFVASDGTRSSAPVTIQVTTRITALTAENAGTGKIRVRMFAQPSASVRYWVSIDGKAKVVTSQRVVTLKVGKGVHRVTVRAAAPGCKTGPTRTTTKTVK